MWQLQLISLYCAVCDNYSIIEAATQRQSNNFRPQFSDEECITVFLWGIKQRKFELKAIYTYAKNHLSSWFPKLPSYQAFCARLNFLAPAFQALANVWINRVSAISGTEMAYLLDSCPIILAKQARSSGAKVAPELCDKGFNSSRDEYYYGVKLHVFAVRHTKTLPTPCAMMVSRASVHDLSAAKQILYSTQPFCGGILYADKAYMDEEWEIILNREYHVNILTPRKKKKDDTIKSGDAYSTFVSGLRQPIESFFNWLNANTNIQCASKVRSRKGLLVHIFGRIAAAIFFRFINP